MNTNHKHTHVYVYTLKRTRVFIEIHSNRAHTVRFSFLAHLLHTFCTLFAYSVRTYWNGKNALHVWRHNAAESVHSGMDQSSTVPEHRNQFWVCLEHRYEFWDCLEACFEKMRGGCINCVSEMCLVEKIKVRQNSDCEF